jgi:predicted ATPase
MQIETIEIHNYKVFQNVNLKNIGSLAVFLGENGVGKSTLFDVFGFIRECLISNVRSALQSRGGYHEVHSRGTDGDISFLFKYRSAKKSPLCTYELQIGLNDKQQPVVNLELLSYRRGSKGQPWRFFEYSLGKGYAITNEGVLKDDIKEAERREDPLKSPDILAINSLGQMDRFKAAADFRNFLEDWFVSDFQIDRMRLTQEVAYSETLNRKGDNIANVAQFLYDQHSDRFKRVLQKMKERIPGVSNVEAKTTDGGSGILLKFQDGRFKDPFSSRYVSDGTIKMFAYLVLLAEPNPHSLLCIEEPENQLYPHLLEILAEEFREYTASGGQVFVSTHSPDLVNAVEPHELYFISKQEDGFSQVKPMSENNLIVRLYNEGDKLGWLWKEGLLTQ